MRIPSGVPGFDALVQGGFPQGAAVVVQGPAGREKDLFLAQFVADGLRRGEAVVVVLSSSSPARYLEDLRQAGIDVDRAVADHRIKFVDWFSYKEEPVQDVQADGPSFKASIDLMNVGIAVSRAITALPRESAKRAAFEILSPALSVYDLPNVYSFAQSTKAKLDRYGFTSLFVLEKEMHDERTLSTLHQPFDGVVDIERVREGDDIVRKVAVLSLKGTAAQSKYVPLEVADRQLRISSGSDRERTLRRQEELIKANPKDPKIWLATARNLKEMGEHERALKCVEAALNLEPSDADGWRLKAEVLEALGRIDEAEMAHIRASAPAPRKEDPTARILGVVAQRLAIDPDDPDALFMKGAALAKRNDLEGAVDALERLAATDEAYPGLWVLKAKLHARRGERDKAQEARRRAQEVERRSERARPDLEPGKPPVEPPATPPARAPVFACPECNATVAESDAICPSCGVLFEGTEDQVAAPPPPKPPRDTRRRGLTNGLVRDTPRGVGRTNGLVNGTRGRTNGLVNGTRGRTNGLVNGTRGRTNGLVNGTRGRTNGLVNGTRGRTNGLSAAGRTNGLTNGLVNGLLSLRSGLTNGLTNGSGFTNGLGTPRFVREVRNARWKLFLIPVVFAALITAPLLSSDYPEVPGPRIDGQFGDWAGIPALTLRTGVANPNVDLTRVALANGPSSLSLMIEVAGQILAGGPDPPGLVDGLYVFVDLDGDATTGYAIRETGADRLLVIEGSNGAVLRANALRFSQAMPDRRDWRGWVDSAPIAAAAGGNRVELAVDWLLLQEGADPVILVASVGSDGSTDFADLLLGLGRGHVEARQVSLAPLVLSGANVPLLHVGFTAIDAPADLSGLTVELLGTAPLSAVGMLHLVDGVGTSLSQRVPVDRTVSFGFPPLVLSPGVPLDLTVTASVSGTTGETLGVRVPSRDAVLAGPAVATLATETGAPRLGYLGQVPAGVVIDGGFAEWTNDTADGAGEPETLGNRAVDVDRFGASFGPADLSFHVGLHGPAMAGTVVAVRPMKASIYSPGLPDRDRDSVPDGIDPLPDDFDNDDVPDVQTGGDHDGDGLLDYAFGGPDHWLNTTIPLSFPAPYAGRNVTVYVGPMMQPPAVGEDRLRLYVDVDNVTATGYYVAGIGADYLIEIRGREGIVSDAILSAHDGAYPGVWSWRKTADVALQVGLLGLEARADVVALVPSPSMYLEMSDWWGGQDTLGVGTRAGGTRSVAPFGGTGPMFVRDGEGVYAFRSTGTLLEAYARASRGANEEIVLRRGSLLIGWRTIGVGGEGAFVPALSGGRTVAAGASLAINGLHDSWEEYIIDEVSVKHNVWITAPPSVASEFWSVVGEMRIPAGAVVSVDEAPVESPFRTSGEIVVEYDGHRIAFQPPYAFESLRPEMTVGGEYAGELVGSTLRLSMSVPTAWLLDARRTYPVVLDPTGIIDTTTSAAATMGPHQRNVFYDGTNFWAFYYDGSTIVYEPSADGLNWVSTKNTAFTTSSIAKMSTWFHDTGSTKIVYITGDIAGNSKTVSVRRGTISGTTITWGTEAQVTTSTQNQAKTPFISRDSSGYVWIASNNKEGGSSFNFAAVRSTNVDDVSAWGTYTNLLTASISGANIQGVILPLGSGEMYALWYAEGAIDGKKYSGTWGSLENIDTTTSASLTRAPSAVVDGAFSVHLVYVDSAGAVKYRKRTATWGSATTLDSGSGNTFPTISLHTTSGDLYAFWISSTSQIKGKKFSGSWTDITDIETNTNAKSGLTSTRNVTSSANIAWTWSQGTASPYDVKFSVLSTSLKSRTIDTTTKTSPLSFNHQRKVFHDGTRFWAFYSDGSNTVYTWSTDALTWESSVVRAFTTNAVDNPSVWFHDTGSTKIVYAVGDTAGGGTTDIRVRRGTISGGTITWGTETGAVTSGATLAQKVGFISRDTSGYLWAVSNNRPSGTTYNVGVTRSTNPDDVSSWGSVTNLMDSSISVNQIYPSIVPQSGGNMYAFWYADGAIDGKRFTGTWSSLENIATTTASVTTKIPSAVVDSSSNVHLVYSNSSGAIVYRQRTTSWQTPTTLSSTAGSISPTITRETTTGNLYVFWISSTNQNVGKKYSGSWSDLTGFDTNTFTKSYVTSPYSVNAEWKVAWMWGQGGSSPREIKINHIPEFEEIALPLAGITLVAYVAGRRRSRRAGRRDA